MARHWYVARTRSHAEYVTMDRLEAAGLEVFLPCVRTPRPRPGRQDTPLFPGYLFVHYDLEQGGWRPLSRVPQLLGLVAFGGVVPPVSDEVIDALVQRVQAINGTGGLWTRFRPGDKVRLHMGPRESLAEVVSEATSPSARVRVLLEFLGRRIYAEVPRWDVQLVKGHDLAENAGGRPPRRTRGRGRWIAGYGPQTGATSSTVPATVDNGRSSS